MPLAKLRNFASEIVTFIKSVAADERIPARDKKVVLALAALILSPIDIIPDWIPLIGWIDDIVLLAIILDYLFNVLDSEILLSHYPWGMKSFVWLRRAARSVAVLTPQFVKDWIWKYKPNVYTNS
jgi:uncharacterized membrane protein YkvA (DUF1232 family)